MTDVARIRLARIEASQRGVRPRPEGSVQGPIVWHPVSRVGGLKVRLGQGKSGLGYCLRRTNEWQVCVRGAKAEVKIGSARMHEHARALAQMWEEGVLSGRIDMV